MTFFNSLSCLKVIKNRTKWLQDSLFCLVTKSILQY